MAVWGFHGDFPGRVLPAGSAVCRRLTTRPGEADHIRRAGPHLATSCWSLAAKVSLVCQPYLARLPEGSPSVNLSGLNKQRSPA
jgi:hypothetical protein